MGIADLTKSLQKLQGIGHQVEQVDLPAMGMTLWIRTLRKKEDHKVYSMLAEGAESGGESLEFLDVFRWETLARSIMAVSLNDEVVFDFRDKTTFTEDGSKEMIDDEDGPVEKCSLLRPVIQNWSRDITGILIRKYQEQLSHVESKIREGVVFEYSSLDEEIEETEARLQDLYSRRQKITEASKESDAVQTLLQTPLGRQAQEDIAQGLHKVEAPTTESQQGHSDEVPTLDQVQRRSSSESAPKPVAKSYPKTIVENGKEIPVVRSKPIDLDEETRLKPEGRGDIQIDPTPPGRSNPNFRGPSDRNKG